MSNPDLPGSYWQEQDDYGAGWRGSRNGSSHDSAPWDNGGAQFFRNGSSRSGRSGRREDDWAAADGPQGRGYRGSRRARGDRTYRSYAGEITGRLSQTADDLRNRLGIRGSAVSRDRRGRNGAWQAGTATDGYSSGRARHASANGYDEHGSGYGNGRSGVRELPEGYWPDDDPGRGLRTRITERIPRRGVGGGGGARGGGGRGGGGWGDGPNGMPRSRGERFKRWLIEGSWWRHWTWKKLLGVIGGGIAAFILLAVIGFFVIYAMTPIPTDISGAANQQSSSVYFSNGKLLGTFAYNNINRQLLTTDQIPQVMDNAMVAAEDRNFYHEGGISITGIARAAYHDLFGNGNLQGGSTITEQYAKNYYSDVGFSRSITTKIKEIFIAIKLAHSRSKPWILTQYLNTVDFGRGAYGVGAAAEAYFGINLANHGQLSIAQAAMLAAMPNEPSVFDPDPKAGPGFSALVARWQYVLVNMARDNAISTQQATALCAYCSQTQAEQEFAKVIKTVPPGENSGFTGYRYFLMNMVATELQQKYGVSMKYIETQGLKITTTFNQSMINGLNRAVAAEQRHMVALGQPLPAYAHIGATLIDPKTGGILAIYGGPGPGVVSTKRCDKIGCWDNNAEVAHQPGSSFKAYVLATAISQDMDVQSSILNGNSPICVPPDWNQADQAALSQRMPVSACKSKVGQGFWPATDVSLGGIAPAEAAAVSSNPAFEDLAHKVGINNIIKMAGNLGVGSTNYFNQGGNDLQNLEKTFGNNGTNTGSVTMALGASGADLTSIEQASTFATFADGGMYHTPHVIKSISGGNRNWPSKVVTRQALPPEVAGNQDFALSFDNTPRYASVGATGYPSAAWDRPVIAKTGTTDCAQSAWFIGAIPQDSLAVTLYTTQQNSTLSATTGTCPQNAQSLNVLPRLPGQYDTGGYGGAWPATIWHTFMSKQFANLQVQQLPTPHFGAPFIKWMQVPKAKPKSQNCQFGNGNGNGNGNGKKCTCPPGVPFCNPNPNPTPTCTQGFFGQPCNGTSPAPSCNPGGQQCNSSSPPVSPSPTVSPSSAAATTLTTTAALLLSAEEPQLRLRASPARLRVLSRSG